MPDLAPVPLLTLMQIRPLQQPVHPNCVIEIMPVQIIVPVKTQPKKDPERLVVDVDRSRVRPVGNALQEDQAAIGLDQPFGAGVAGFQESSQHLPTRRSGSDTGNLVGGEKVVDTEPLSSSRLE